MTTVAVVMRTGRLGYALDDAYIHLALGSNLARHGTFGIEPGHFESASSSPLWTLTIAFGDLLGVPLIWMPLVIGAPLGVLATWALCRQVPLSPGSSPIEWVAVACVPLTIGVAPLVLTGMEHAAHVAIVVWLLGVVVAPQSSRWPWLRPLLLGVGTAVRLETAFIGVGLAVLELRRHGFTERAARRVAADAAPVAGVVAGIAAVNLAFGQDALPNSVVAKAVAGRSLVPDVGGALDRVLDDPLLLLLVLLAGGVAAAPPRLVGDRARDVGLVVAAAATLHVLWADVGWFYRYQSYLVAGGVMVLLLLLGDASRPGARLALSAVLVCALGPRAALLLQTPKAASDVQVMQEQVATFLVRERPGEPVALNDIGYPAHLGAGPIVDLFGLADHEMLDLRRGGRFTAPEVEHELDEAGADLMIIFERVFSGVVPSGWSRVERWCYPERILVFDECIAFFASPGEVPRLRAQLDEFARRLPSEVERRVDR